MTKPDEKMHPAEAIEISERLRAPGPLDSSDASLEGKPAQPPHHPDSGYAKRGKAPPNLPIEDEYTD